MEGGIIQIIGEGNVAWHLAAGFSQSAVISEIHVFSRSIAKRVNFEGLDKKIKCFILDGVSPDALITLFAVNDDALPALAERFSGLNHLVAHTAGSVSIDIFKGHFSEYGSFYPLQTFSLQKKMHWEEIPVLMDSNSENAINKLKGIAHCLTNTVLRASDDQRLKTHIAAVMVNNFTNHLFTRAGQFMELNGLDFNILKPLIRETIFKLETMTPMEAQTGPARRHDNNTISMHLRALENDQDLKDIYLMLTRMINAYYSR